MEFDCKRAVERYGEELCAIAAQLIVMAGMQGFRMVETLPRHLYLRILSILRPAEYAARRLILMAACKLEWDIPGARQQRAIGEALKGGTENPDSGLPLTKEETTGNTAISSSPQRGSEGRVETRGSTPIDLPREAKPSGMANWVRGKLAPRPPHQLRLTRCARKPAYPLPAGARNKPAEIRVPAFALFDPFKHYGDPWLTPEQIAALDNPSDIMWPAPALPPDEPVDGKHLCRRIRALANAMQDIEGQALRLARWRARRHLDTAKPKRWTPLRVGQPPGWKRRPKSPVEEVLKDCHTLALDAWNTRGPPASVSEA